MYSPVARSYFDVAANVAPVKLTAAPPGALILIWLAVANAADSTAKTGRANDTFNVFELKLPTLA